ncbi:stage II sporulation protein B (plasmid) [Bacillus sp. 31A1R]|uniref:Stage II sporulation protein B n=1 Tax=Robertmurraya mangrovi TaxID=3098077 RepID=A0ABU5IUJ9_9BACI|nr:stage II sporulation protein B [Bacillus sp. 31A1R]MDZ5470813.1 stage II sporulation protein B [Bacillus sp. 31A1R]
MDKSEHKTITIKINGKNRPIEEKNKAKENRNEEESIRAQEDLVEKKEKVSPKMEETLAFQEIAAAQEAEDDQFDWILPELNDQDDMDIKEYKIASNNNKPPKGKGWKGLSTSIKKKNRNGIIPSIFFAVFFAVLLGTSFGFIMLKLVITEKIVETATPPGVAIDNNSGDKEENKGGTAAETSEVEVPTITSYIVQGGVFSTTDAANQAEEAVSKKGVPTRVININNQTALFIGLADNIENAKTLGKESGIDSFAKEVDFGGGTLKSSSKVESELLKLAPALYEVLIEGTAEISLSNSISNELLATINEQAKAWSTIDSKNIKVKELQQLKQELDNAIIHVNSYGKKKEPKVEKDLQQSLLNFLAIYQAL